MSFKFSLKCNVILLIRSDYGVMPCISTIGGFSFSKYLSITSSALLEYEETTAPFIISPMIFNG